MADRPLRPAMDRCLGRPLPYQLANPTQAPPATGASKDRPPLIPRREDKRCYTVLARVSSSCPLLPGRFLRVTHPSATLLTPEGAFSFDLHVLSLPPTFNLSHDQTLQFMKMCKLPCTRFLEAQANLSSIPNLRNGHPHEWLVCRSMCL